MNVVPFFDKHSKKTAEDAAARLESIARHLRDTGGVGQAFAIVVLEEREDVIGVNHHQYWGKEIGPVELAAMYVESAHRFLQSMCSPE